jgi:hypothetical protein
MLFGMYLGGFSALKAAHSRLTIRNFRQKTLYVSLFVVTLPLIPNYYKKC